MMTRWFTCEVCLGSGVLLSEEHFTKDRLCEACRCLGRIVGSDEAVGPAWPLSKPLAVYVCGGDQYRFFGDAGSVTFTLPEPGVTPEELKPIAQVVALAHVPGPCGQGEAECACFVEPKKETPLPVEDRYPRARTKRLLAEAERKRDLAAAEKWAKRENAKDWLDRIGFVMMWVSLSAAAIALISVVVSEMVRK